MAQSFHSDSFVLDNPYIVDDILTPLRERLLGVFGDMLSLMLRLFVERYQLRNFEDEVYSAIDVVELADNGEQDGLIEADVLIEIETGQEVTVGEVLDDVSNLNLDYVTEEEMFDLQSLAESENSNIENLELDNGDPLIIDPVVGSRNLSREVSKSALEDLADQDVSGKNPFDVLDNE